MTVTHTQFVQDTALFGLGGILQGPYTLTQTGAGVARPDFNGDGTSDILLRNHATGAAGYLAVLPGGAAGAWHALGATSTAYDVVGISDFNGDGKSDILFRNNATGNTRYLALPAGAGVGAWHPLGVSPTSYGTHNFPTFG